MKINPLQKREHIYRRRGDGKVGEGGTTQNTQKELTSPRNRYIPGMKQMKQIGLK